MGALDDPRDVERHDCGGQEAVDKIIRRMQSWVDANPDTAHLRCEHGSYVGYERALAYLCALCPEPSVLKPEIPMGMERGNL